MQLSEAAYLKRKVACKPPQKLQKQFSEPKTGVYLSDYVRGLGQTMFYLQEDAMKACIRFRGGGITCDKTGYRWQVRQSRIPKKSPYGEISLIRNKAMTQKREVISLLVFRVKRKRERKKTDRLAPATTATRFFFVFALL